MPVRQTRCIILKIAGFGESDKLVTLYSPDIGRVTAIAKGAKRSKKRFVNKLEEFSLLAITYRPPRNNGLYFLSEAELENPFLSLRTIHQRYVVSMLACELVIRFTGEHTPEPKIFCLLHWLLDSVNRGVPAKQAAAFFHLRLLGAAGYQPELSHCDSCNQQVNNSLSFSLRPANGSLVCSRCNHNKQSSDFNLSIQTIRFLQTAQQIEPHRLERLQMPVKAAQETLRVLYRYSQHLLQRDIHSWRFVKETAYF